ncbi:DUF2255 family protein [Rathayibacter soli]|uniref:DUF2255 family protein n=1 Tax=Rathayibacter soli TaxID=3144168 RepID=UPI0027E51A81|nr:DUF2255 family protein [Glaciibacter superstes]
MGTTRVLTVGHSTHPIEEFIRMLRANAVACVADVRTIAKSRHNPQFAEDELRISLPASGIEYRRLENLGGLRHTTKKSANGAWRNASFRGYADYMQTPAFDVALAGLIELAQAQPKSQAVAIMCAEAVPWRCHRSLIGDALLVRGIEVDDIMTATQTKPHTLTSFAHVEGTRVTYPATSTTADPTNTTDTDAEDTMDADADNAMDAGADADADTDAFAALTDYLDTTDTVTIVTTRKTGEEKRTPIWSVVAGGKPYVRSVLGPRGAWYRRAVASGAAAFVLHGRQVAVNVQHVTDDEAIAAVDAAYSAKYSSQSSSLHPMLQDESRACTLLIVPAA